MKLITYLLTLLMCGDSIAQLSLTNGDNKLVTCFFNSGEVYKDIVFNVRFDKNNNTSEFLILPNSKFESKVLAVTEKRLTLHLINKNNEIVLLNIFFDSGNFDIKDQKYEGSGVCEEKR